MLSITSDFYGSWIRQTVTTLLVAGAALLAASPGWSQSPSATPSVSGGIVAPQPAPPPPRVVSDANSAQNSLEQARRLIKENQIPLALQQLEQGLKRHPRDPQLRFLYATVLNDQGRTQDALEVFIQLTEDFPELPEPHNNVAVLFAARGELDKARAALENAVKALPSYSLGHENLGDVYLRMAARSYELAQLADRSSQTASTKLRLSRALLERVLSPAP